MAKKITTRATSWFMRERRKVFFGATQSIHFLIAAIILALHLFLFAFGKVDGFENMAWDSFFRHRPALATHPDIAVIEIDEESLEEIGRFPWPQHYFSEMIRLLDEWGAKAIVFDLLFKDFPVYEEEMSLESVLRSQAKVYFPAQLASKTEKKIWVHSLPVVLEPEGEGTVWLHSAPEVRAILAGTGHMNLEPDADGVLRRVPAYLSSGNEIYPQLMLPVASDFLDEALPSRYRSTLPVDAQGQVVINWFGKWDQVFKHFSYADLIRSDQALQLGGKPVLDPTTFKGKICLIGLSAGESATLRTSPMASETPVLGVHANLLNSFLTKQYIKPLSKKAGLVALALLGLVAILLFVFLRGGPAFFAALFLGVGWNVLAFVLFWQSGWLLPVVQAVFMILTLFIFSAIYTQIVSAEEQTRLFDLATRDGLTGLYVIRHFREILNRVVGEVNETGEPLSLILMDLDNFKPVNDTHGHPAGDEVLKKTAEIIFSCLRSKRKPNEMDYVGRYGGEEFIVLIRNCDLEKSAQTIAERIRASIDRAEYRWQGTLIPVTVSVGVSCLHPGEKAPDGMVHRADEALYQAKRSGKNRVCKEIS